MNDRLPPGELRSRLRSLADEVIGPVAEGYLRPWMCRGDPTLADVFLVGANPATTFPADTIERETYLDALVSGDGRLHDLYLDIRGGSSSPTRRNIERLTGLLQHHGASPALETNVWTLPTRDLASLRRADPATVAASGRVMVALIELLAPAVVIVHGAEATRGLSQVLGRRIDPADPADPVQWLQGRPTIVAIPSLSPPRANVWLAKATNRLAAMATELQRQSERISERSGVHTVRA